MNESDLNIFIDVRDGDGAELISFLRDMGVEAKPHFGVFNGPMPEMSDLVGNPAPYVWATATAAVLRVAIKAYADSRKKRFIVSRLKTGVKVDATNYSAEELKEMGVLDLGKFEGEERQPKE